MRIYVASSWRNEQQPSVVQALRAAGHEVYDFKNPRPGDSGFHWSEIDPAWKTWTPEAFRYNLGHPIAKAGFRSDMDALEACDACVLVLPCGRSAHLELGWAAGAGKRTAVLMLKPEEPELMYRMLHAVCTSIEEVVSWAHQAAPALSPREEPVPHACGPNRDGIGEWWLQEGPKVTWTDRDSSGWSVWTWHRVGSAIEGPAPALHRDDAEGGPVNRFTRRVWYSRPWQWVMWRWVEFCVGYWWPWRLRLAHGLSQEEADHEVYLALRKRVWEGEYGIQPPLFSPAPAPSRAQALVAVYFDRGGTLLWKEDWNLRRMFAVGQTFFRESREYAVISAKRTDDGLVYVVAPAASPSGNGSATPSPSAANPSKSRE